MRGQQVPCARAHLANASTRPEQDGRAAVGFKTMMEGSKLGLQFADSLRIAVDGRKMRRQQIEHTTIAITEVERLAQANDVHGVRPKSGKRDAEHMFDANGSIDFVIKAGVVP